MRAGLDTGLLDLVSPHNEYTGTGKASRCVVERLRRYCVSFNAAAYHYMSDDTAVVASQAEIN